MSHTSILPAAAVPFFLRVCGWFPFLYCPLLVRSTNIEKKKYFASGEADMHWQGGCSSLLVCLFQLLVLYYALVEVVYLLQHVLCMFFSARTSVFILQGLSILKAL